MNEFINLKIYCKICLSKDIIYLFINLFIQKPPFSYKTIWSVSPALILAS